MNQHRKDFKKMLESTFLPEDTSRGGRGQVIDIGIN